MCQQLAVLKKIHKAKKMNGYAVELAEAQAKDFLQMEKRITNIEKDVSDIKTEQVAQGAKLDLIIERLNSPVEQERKDGLVWSAMKSFLKTTFGKSIIILFLFCLGLAGQRILELTGLIRI